MVSAGSLEPASPPAATLKTLADIQPKTPISSLPYVISSPGSYYVTGNLNCPTLTGNAGISISSDDVTLDLMGHTLTGLEQSLVHGISSYNRKNIEIRNGAIKDFYTGISLGGTESSSCKITKIHSFSNANTGILISGSGSVIKNCIVHDNGSEGVMVGSKMTISGSVSYNNVRSGISSGNDSLLSANRVYANSEKGIYAGDNCTVIKCKATGNVRSGIQTGSASKIANNTVSDNERYGIVAQNTCTVVDNTVNHNGYWGITSISGCVITGNHVTNNNYINNSTYGGIRTNDSCLVKENMCYSNNVSNIYISGAGNLIESNFVTNSTASSTKDPGVGIFLFSTGGYCVGNRAYNFTNPFFRIHNNNNTIYYTGSNYEFIYGKP